MGDADVDWEGLDSHDGPAVQGRLEVRRLTEEQGTGNKSVPGGMADWCVHFFFFLLLETWTVVHLGFHVTATGAN